MGERNHTTSPEHAPNAKRVRAVLAIGTVAVFLGGGIVYLLMQPDSASAESKPLRTARAATNPKRAAQRRRANPAATQRTQFVARVNNDRISWRELADLCVERYGEEVLENLVNKRIIEQECRDKAVRVTSGEIDAEITFTSYAIMRATCPAGRPFDVSLDDLETFESYVEALIESTTTRALNLETGRTETFTVTSWGNDILAIQSMGYTLPRHSPTWTEAAEAWHLDREYAEAVGPLLAIGLVAPALAWRGRSLLPGAELTLALGLFAALLAFTSANQYARLQWNTGFRMLVPAVPLLFLATAAVLVRLPRALAVGLGAAAVAHAACLAMVREDPLQSIAAVATGGPTLPWLTTLWRTGDQYLPLLQRIGPQGLPLLVLAGLSIAILWWLPRRAATSRSGLDSRRVRDVDGRS